MQEGKAKKEMKIMKRWNRSLVAVSSKIRQSLGIVAIQPEKGVFFLGKGMYVKIYAVQAQTLSDGQISEYIDMLCGQPQFRFRITSLYESESRMDAGKILRFLSVYTFSADFAGVDKRFSDLDVVLERAGQRFGNIYAEACTIDHVLMFIYMNLTGELKKFDREELLGKKAHLLDHLALSDGKKTLCFLGKEYPGKMDTFKAALLHLGYDLQICVDIQGMKEDDHRMLNYIIEQNYCMDCMNAEGSEEEIQIVNLTFMLVLTGIKEAEVCKVSEIVRELARNNKMLLFDDKDIQKQIHMSVCTFGLHDFHAMRNVPRDVVKSLII